MLVRMPFPDSCQRPQSLKKTMNQETSRGMKHGNSAHLHCKPLLKLCSVNIQTVHSYFMWKVGKDVETFQVASRQLSNIFMQPGWDQYVLQQLR